MIRKVYEVDPLLCPKCGGRMKIIAFITDNAVVDRIIRHLRLTFYKCRLWRVIDCLTSAKFGQGLIDRGLRYPLPIA